MIPTLDDVFALSRAHLADPDGEVYNNQQLLPFAQMAYGEMYEKMLNLGLSAPEATAYYTLPANTVILTPATAGISNFGELQAQGLSERLAGSTEKYIPLAEQENLSQWDPVDRLRFFEWSGDAFNFVGATTDRQLKIEYWASASAPTSGPLGIDGCQLFIAARAAALACRIREPQLSQQLDVDARGPRLDGNAGYLYTLVNPMVLAQQRTTSVRPRFRPNSRFRREVYGYPIY